MKLKSRTVLYALAFSLAVLTTTGCRYFGIGSTTATPQAATQEAPPPANDQTKVYQRYKDFMEQINSDRSKQGLPPEPVISYDEWMKAGAK
jgi:hypothetical protein